MTLIRRSGLFVPALVLAVACSTGGGQPTAVPQTARTTSQQPASVPPASEMPASRPPATAAPQPMASAPTAQPGATLDPSRSDAGIAARVTISGDTFMDRDGTYDVYGVDSDGSECNGAFEEPDYTVVAWVDDAPYGQIYRFSITVKAAEVPATDGPTAVQDGRLSFDFNSESGFGTQYTAALPDEGTLALEITRAGPSLTFEFDGTTKAGVRLVGQLICAEAG